MKIFQSIAGIIVIVALIFSCSKESTSPSQTNGVNLTGASGSNKSWMLTAVTYTVNGGLAQSLTLSACVLDNVYKFSNNPTQDFVQTDGAVKCQTADSTVTESGNWAFTNDGKNLVVEGEWFDDLSQETDFQYLFTALGEPSTVVQLTATALTVSYSFTSSSSGNKYVVTAIFAKV